MDVTQIMCPRDARNLARLQRMQDIYTALEKIAMRYKPKTIFEIGVRAGYSAYTLITGSGQCEWYEGWDVDDRAHYGGPWLDWAKYLVGECLPATDWDIYVRDSQQATELEHPRDLIHVDGDHTYEGCLHDMTLCWPYVNPGGVMVVDDATYLPGPRRAIANFTAEDVARLYLEPSPTGSMVFEKGKE